MENLNQILADALAAVAASENEAGLDEVRVQYLGKKG
ncbi:MAG: phenylalanine--tRNA ligase subunit alpha, partial [Pseudomonadota bacterium]|nr:phenylalanine--tRNA ligase subunit alpha [Pseudomonadota bacterium]